MSTRPLNATAASLLGFLHDGPSSGWDLLARARATIGPFWNVTSSQVYREARLIEAAGLIRGGQSGPPSARLTLTPAGRAAFATWYPPSPRRGIDPPPPALDAQLRPAPPDPHAAAFAVADRVVDAERLAGYLAARRALEAATDPDHFAAATLDFGVRYETAVLEWLDHLPHLPVAPNPDGRHRLAGGVRGESSRGSSLPPRRIESGLAVVVDELLDGVLCGDSPAHSCSARCPRRSLRRLHRRRRPDPSAAFAAAGADPAVGR